MFTPYEYTISRHWVCPIVYGDLDGLDDNEIRQLQDFIDDLPGPGHWADWPDSAHFARDEITGLMADCVDAIYLSRTEAQA